MEGGAEIDGEYRYRLWRYWGTKKTVLFVMLNPSTADAEVDDPTIRRCIGFARRWGFERLEVGNLFALRSTDPKALRTHPEPIGEYNNAALWSMSRQADMVVAAWGASGGQRGLDVARMLGPDVQCLGLTKGSEPRHPLYVHGNTEPKPLWRVGYTLRQVFPADGNSA